MGLRQKFRESRAKAHSRKLKQYQSLLDIRQEYLADEDPVDSMNSLKTQVAELRREIEKVRQDRAGTQGTKPLDSIKIKMLDILAEGTTYDTRGTHSVPDYNIEVLSDQSEESNLQEFEGTLRSRQTLASIENIKKKPNSYKSELV